DNTLINSTTMIKYYGATYQAHNTTKVYCIKAVVSHKETHMDHMTKMATC
ncbi:hypothetical protein ACJX0J_012897, partial [Zea mays]